MGMGRDLWNEVEGLLVSQDSPGLVMLFTHDAVYSGPTWRVQGREGIRALFEAYFRAFSGQQERDIHADRGGGRCRS